MSLLRPPDQPVVLSGSILRVDRESGAALPNNPLATNPELRTELGEAARADVAAYTPEVWAAGMRAALKAAGAARSEDP